MSEPTFEIKAKLRTKVFSCLDELIKFQWTFKVEVNTYLLYPLKLSFASFSSAKLSYSVTTILSTIM